MAETKIADVVVPVVFNDYMTERNIRQSKIYKSGIVVINPQMNEYLAGGSDQFTTPFWKSIVAKGESQIPSESTAVTVNNITTGKYTTRRQMRVNAWGANALSAILAGEDPMNAIASMVGDYWDDDMQGILMAEVKGVYEDNKTTNSGDMTIDITGAGAGKDKISSETIIDALFTQGDRWNEFTAIAMHSTPYSTLVKLNLIDFLPDNKQDIGWGTYFGKTVIVDDYHTMDGSDYLTVLFKPGAFAYGQTTVNYEPTSIDRDETKGMGVEVLHNRRVFCLHPYGFNWVEGSISGVSPTNAELGSADHWKRVASDIKNTGLAFIKSKG